MISFGKYKKYIESFNMLHSYNNNDRSQHDGLCG